MDKESNIRKAIYGMRCKYVGVRCGNRLDMVGMVFPHYVKKMSQLEIDRRCARRPRMWVVNGTDSATNMNNYVRFHNEDVDFVSPAGKDRLFEIHLKDSWAVGAYEERHGVKTKRV